MEVTVEHHAVIFALLAKETILSKGKDGEKVILEAVRQYGLERGKRMAEAALRHKDTADEVGYQVYGEWKSTTGTRKSENFNDKDGFRSIVHRCEWDDAWRKYGLIDYGKYYCMVVDESLYKGFNPKLHIDVKSTLSGGDSCCYFGWGKALSDEQLCTMKEKKAELGDSCIQGFDYHTAHIWRTVSSIIESRFGKDGKRIVEKAKDEFINMFGKGIMDKIEEIDI